MYPLYFYICLLASLFSIIALLLLALIPVNLTLVPKTAKKQKSVNHQSKARSPTRQRQTLSYWDTLTDDNDDL